MSTPDSTPPSTPEPVGPTAGTSRAAVLRRFGPLLLAVLAFLVYRAVTYDDGTRDITIGRCVTASEAGDVRTVDCADASSLGTVVFVQRNAFTDEFSVRRLCAQHGSGRAFTSALAQGGTGTVVCVVPGP